MTYAVRWDVKIEEPQVAELIFIKSPLEAGYKFCLWFSWKSRLLLVRDLRRPLDL